MAAATLPISGTLSQAWFGCGLATVIIPLGIFFGSQLANTDDNDDNSNQSQTATGSSHGWYFGGYGSDTSQVPIPPGFLIVSYTWSLLVFLGIILHGFKTMQAGTDLSSVVIATVMFANYSILLLFLLGGAQGAVDTYSTCVRGYDFVGQFGVMVGDARESDYALRCVRAHSFS